MSVAGSSFRMSTKTISPAVSMAPRATGRSTAIAAEVSVRPMVRAAWIIEGVTRASPASMGSSAAAIRRAE